MYIGAGPLGRPAEAEQEGEQGGGWGGGQLGSLQGEGCGEEGHLSLPNFHSVPWVHSRLSLLSLPIIDRPTSGAKDWSWDQGM